MAPIILARRCGRMLAPTGAPARDVEVGCRYDVVEQVGRRQDFVGLDGLTYLYTAAECPMLAAVRGALDEYAANKSMAQAGRDRHFAALRRCRELAGHLLDVPGDDVAFAPSASFGLNAVVGSIDFQPGDNVVVNDLEFPAVVLPCLRLARRGVDVRLVRHVDWDITTEQILQRVDSGTRLVALSHVSYISGLRHDVATIGRALRGTKTLRLVDATQSIGVLPVPTADADFVVTSSYKWLLGIHGLGLLYWNRPRRPEIEPPMIGGPSLVDAYRPDRYEAYALKPDAGRFEVGYPNFPAIYALRESLGYLLAAGPERTAQHVQDLGDRMIAGLKALGLAVMTPAARARRGASVSFAHVAPERLGRGLAERDVHVWAGDGRVRASTHFFNDEGDVERYLEGLAAVL
jgi:cysteine desulfurase/selenocysteine lyase